MGAQPPSPWRRGGGEPAGREAHEGRGWIARTAEEGSDFPPPPPRTSLPTLLGPGGRRDKRTERRCRFVCVGAGGLWPKFTMGKRDSQTGPSFSCLLLTDRWFIFV